MTTSLPTLRPVTPLLDQISTPVDIKALTPQQLPQLAAELRSFLLYCVGQTGGHFGAGLGVIELTVALHYLLNMPDDCLVWDVGHQSYPHKILTGRREQMLSMRQQGGLAPFPKRAESPFDSFGTGHSSTSISAALGMALAARLDGKAQKSVAVIGDGAMTAGMAFEALTHAAHTGADLLVILNDNDMSISPNESGLATYLDQTQASHLDGQATGALFGALTFTYSGPIDGHDFDQLLPALQKALTASGPQFLHVITQKGHGFKPAENDPVGYHAITKIEPVTQPKTVKPPKFCNIFGQWICNQAAQDQDLVAITPAMREGSDLVAFARDYPTRYFDVAIAEQHAATLAAGLACGGKKPVLAIYSTFLQRAYDQVVHDIAIQSLDVLLAVDRAGLVGEDGATHAGLFDIALLRPLPDALIMTPSTEQELYLMLNTGYHYKGLAAVRYPRGSGNGEPIQCDERTLEIGKAQQLRQGKEVALLNFGPLLPHVLAAAEQLDASVIDMRFVKPLDMTLLTTLANSHQLLVTVEDHAVLGGAGSAVEEALQAQGITTPVLTLGVPDHWIEHATRAQQLQICELDAAGIEQKIRDRLAR